MRTSYDEVCGVIDQPPPPGRWHAGEHQNPSAKCSQLCVLPQLGRGRLLAWPCRLWKIDYTSRLYSICRELYGRGSGQGVCTMANTSTVAAVPSSMTPPSGSDRGCISTKTWCKPEQVSCRADRDANCLTGKTELASRGKGPFSINQDRPQDRSEEYSGSPGLCMVKEEDENRANIQYFNISQVGSTARVNEHFEKRRTPE